MDSKALTYSQKGLLNTRQLTELREVYSLTNISYENLARKYNVSVNTIRKAMDPNTPLSECKDIVDQEYAQVRKPRKKKTGPKKRTTYQLGSKNPNSKLNEKDVARIKMLLKTGLSYREIGERYGVIFGTIARIARGETWTEIKADDIL